MEDVLWYLLASSRGGPTRTRLLRLLDERPRNANQLATALELDYTTVRHHLDVLMDNNVVRRAGDDYAAVYLFTEQVETNWHTVEEILDTVDGGDAAATGDETGAGSEPETGAENGSGTATEETDTEDTEGS